MKDDMKNITAAQMKAARSLLGISAEELAMLAGVGIATVRRAELREGDEPMSDELHRAVKAALEKAGVKFLWPGAAGGRGVRLLKD